MVLVLRANGYYGYDRCDAADTKKWKPIQISRNTLRPGMLAALEF
jgi:hypothetical protein